MLTVGSLFAGIGGIDLGLERTGKFRTLWFCERDPYCRRVLAKYWPTVPIVDDVADVDESAPRVDVLVGGFPCQPVSHAGRRKAQDDERWLWPEVERCIRVLRPRGILLENVPGLLTAGFDDVIGGLAACGYDAEWDCIPAAALGAPHLRDRVFIIATPRPEFRRHLADRHDAGSRDTVRAGWDAPWDGSPSVAYAERGRQREQRKPRGPEHSAPDRAGKINRPIDDGIWPAEPNVGRVANGIPNRVDRLRALGNAVVPQVAEYVALQLLKMMGETDE